ncbi:sugar ABC transporter substrate-binding protein [Sphaerochaeta halotolerans]|uniref:Sugar ABC transporter substrate-binding protein n=1 Tax=Sphaerochaeta halotolerans TaxID=2293840 RepID=A0A372MJY7_9SPIR|nr:sugar ABC transporter substrate-binding protein [Sphaerochaeta halotolerans]RFU96091.1 sugar ABC transporter substrate-binding protein [Sphaerochaeta halotolerans]
MKRFTFLLVALVLIGGLVFAAGSSEQEKEKITVIMPRHEMDLDGLWEKQTREFEEETGIQVEFIQMSWDEVQTKVMIDLSAGGSTYDVIEFDNGWVEKFVATGWLEPLNSYGTDEYFDSLLPGILNTFTVDGDILGVGWNNDTRFFFYNREMLDKAGIKEAPKTWAEVVEQSSKLKSAGISEYPMAEYWNQEWALANSIAFYLYSFGANYFDEDGNITINDAEGIETLQFMLDILKEYKIVNPSSITLSQEAAADLFYRGSSAFFFQGPPSTYSYANDPSMSSVVGQVEVASWLPGKTTDVQATLTLPEAFAIPKTSENKNAAWKYIEYMISAEKDKERSLQIGSLPMFSDAYEDPELLAKYPHWIQFGAQSEVARALPLVSWYDELVEKTIVVVQQMFQGSRTPAEAADEIAKFLEGREYNGKTLK